MKKALGGSQYKKYGKTHYERNKDKYIKGVRDRQRRNMKYIRAYKEDHPCVDCGFSNWMALDFDHVIGNKVKSVSNAAWHGWGIPRLQEEIDKCEIRCANCHRIKTLTKSNKK